MIKPFGVLLSIDIIAKQLKLLGKCHFKKVLTPIMTGLSPTHKKQHSAWGKVLNLDATTHVEIEIENSI